jgi:hypothetical protein
MYKSISLLVILICLAGGLSAQSFGEIHGSISDENGSPLPGANVWVTAGERQIGTMTDIDGKFKLKPLASGMYNVSASFIGYEPFLLTGVNVDPDQITFIKNKKLSLDVNMIPDVVIETYTIPLIDPEETNKMTMLAADIEHSPARKNLVGFIASISSEIKSNEDGELYFRGTRPGSVQYIVDGMKINGAFRGLPSSGVGSLSVYTGGIPAKYGDVTGGVIVIESKNYFDLYNQWLHSQK